MKLESGFLTPELRAEAGAAAAALKKVISTERAAAGDYLAMFDDRPAVAAEMVRVAQNPGMADATAPLVRFDLVLGNLHPVDGFARLVAACAATHPVQIKLFNGARAQIGAAVKQAVTPFFTAHTLEQLPFSTEIEQRVNSLAARLRLSHMQNFVESLRHAEMTAQVLEDLAAGREVFTLEPAEVPAAA